MPRSPVVSGEQLIRFLTKLGYEVVRQKGSHIRLKSLTEIGDSLEYDMRYLNYCKRIKRERLKNSRKPQENSRERSDENE